MSVTAAARPPGMLGLYRAFWRFAAGHRLRVAASSALLVGSQVIKLSVPFLTAQAINALQTDGLGNLQHAALMMLAVIGVSVLSWTLHGPGRVIERSVGIAVRGNLADGLYARLGRLPLAWHERNHSGETLHRLEKTTGALSSFASSQFIYLQNAVNLIGPIVALALISHWLGLGALAGLIAIGAVIIHFDRRLIVLATRENEAERRYNASLVDYLSNISTVASLRLQGATRSLLRTRMAAVFEPLRRSVVLVEVKWCAVDLLGVLLTWSLVAAYALMARGGGEALLLGNLFMVFQYANQAGGVIGSLAANFQSFARMQADYASADPVWNAEERRAPATSIPADWRRIDLARIEFNHSRRRGDVPSLSEVSLRLRRGERIALVGPSGAGKSTLMRLMAGLYDAERGRIVVDGVTYPELRHLGPIATLVPQDAEVFEGTVRENLGFGVDHAPQAIDAAVRIAGFAPVLDGLPQGLDTVISERGLNLSGGQKQRLALARGILAAAGSAVLLLDEPTSSLDPATEAQIYAGLREVFPDATVISSVHRMNVLPRFDRVVLMQAGRVVDSGSVDELLVRQPLFQTLWRSSQDGARTGTHG
jgi:ABC-type multidrug transport system fused ATPase/permease subunit